MAGAVLFNSDEAQRRLSVMEIPKLHPDIKLVEATGEQVYTGARVSAKVEGA